MGEDLGGITYDKDAALYPGASFPEGESEEFVKTEVLLVERDGEELSDVQDYEDSGVSGNRREMENQTGQELEALAIAQRIKEIVGKEQIVDKETKEYRPVEYGGYCNPAANCLWMGRNLQGSTGISGDSRILYIKNRIFLCNRDCDCIELSEGV